MSELLCVKFTPCVWLFILFQVCIFHDTMFKREKKLNPNLISQRDEFHFLKKKKKKSGGASPIFIEFITEKLVSWGV